MTTLKNKEADDTLTADFISMHDFEVNHENKNLMTDEKNPIVLAVALKDFVHTFFR